MFGAVPFGGMAFASLLTPVVSGGGGGDSGDEENYFIMMCH
jgi:hypothetical protein